MKYRLKTKVEDNNMRVTCACGKGVPDIFIDESSKEEFKMLMGWDETEFFERTIKMDDAEHNKEVKESDE